MIGKAEFEKMKPSAIIMNVGRGPVIDEPAMIDALRTKRIRGAALDVFDIEPLPPDSPFWDLENVFMTAHCADHVHGWVESAVVFFIEQFNRWRKGEPLKNIVDKRAGY
jgi:phosphoglycerate dehydrogenase-like enzyme